MEDYIKVDTLVSCIRRDENSVLVFPSEIRNQLEIHEGSCLHHAFSSVIEGLHLTKWEEENNAKATERLAVDVGYLIRMYPPAILTSQMIDKIVYEQETYPGKIRDQTLEFDSFNITGFTNYKVVFKYNEQDVMAHLADRKPAIGVFSFTKECKPRRDKKIWQSNHETQSVKCPICKKLLPSSHVVCVTGYADAVVNGEHRVVYQYLDSYAPAENSPDGDEICYMTINSMTRIIIPHIDLYQNCSPPNNEPHQAQ